MATYEIAKSIFDVEECKNFIKLFNAVDKYRDIRIVYEFLKINDRVYDDVPLPQWERLSLTGVEDVIKEYLYHKENNTEYDLVLVQYLDLMKEKIKEKEFKEAINVQKKMIDIGFKNSLRIMNTNQTPWGIFTRMENTINFKESFSSHNSVCDIHVSVKLEPVMDHRNPNKIERWVFNISYRNVLDHSNLKSFDSHPLAEIVKRDGDDTLLEGSYVAGNSITFHMLQCLLSEETDEHPLMGDNDAYDTGVVTDECYKGQIMRALTEMEV
tara:strand:+ start:10172 stop:10978 length:807 start_codon:yes stop_codon:yes gene_type:complete